MGDTERSHDKVRRYVVLIQGRCQEMTAVIQSISNGPISKKPQLWFNVIKKPNEVDIQIDANGKVDSA